MKKLALPVLLLLSASAPAYAAECECRPIEYEQLLNMPVGELREKVEQYERLKENYAYGGSTNCFYTCAKEGEHLRNVLVRKESELARDRAARRAAEQDSAPPRRPSFPEPAPLPSRLITGPASP